ncbi:hypothetical protein CCACVL1_15988 [Corchorus capsularis]|uniref:Uncharacterized protein n=1 Tax=Corchorus capsularis TaxID=210143 RepID=A0A1R3I001_COCAP|nr:hypothetical protein CCACVL1_15988 [Corchorus capsularis]
MATVVSNRATKSEVRVSLGVLCLYNIWYPNKQPRALSNHATHFATKINNTHTLTRACIPSPHSTIFTPRIQRFQPRPTNSGHKFLVPIKMIQQGKTFP